jgi:DNA modification methylase
MLSSSMDKTELFDEKGESRGFYSAKNRLNDLTGREWVFWTRSVITKPYPPNFSHKLRSRHGGQKPPELCRDIINVFTKKGATVLDPFMGVGGVLLGAALAGRRATGIEIEPKWIDLYRRVCEQEGLPALEALPGEAGSVLDTLRERTFDFVFTDVPYFAMDRAPRSPGTYKKTGKAARPAPGTRLKPFNAITYGSKEEWLDRMHAVFAKAAGLLKPGGYVAVFIGDMVYAGEYHCLSAELAGRLKTIPGLVWKANLIWYDVSKKLHLYGYQYTYIPSMIHQNIVIFKKETHAARAKKNHSGSRPE